jgi:uncharacterized repeat protein (TIGR03806 family)
VRIRFVPVILLLAVATFHCVGNDPPVIHGGAPDGGGVPQEDAGTLAAHGLESRPANPTCVAPPPPPPVTAYPAALVEAFPSRVRATTTVSLVQAPGDASRWFVVKKSGVIETFSNSPGVTTNTVFLNMAGRNVFDSGESGLHGIAFHPGWPATPKAYVSFVSNEGGVYFSNIALYQSKDLGATLDPTTFQTVFRFQQPGTATNHKGGHLEFGPDGHLYAGFGDCAFNRGTLAQDPHSYCGKLIRIDVNAAAPYAIPPTNPYASSGGLKEIYALGFRNPWRWSFDRTSGELWMGDVGENTYEEVDRVTSGGNYGWPIFEANHCIRRMGTCTETYVLPPVDFYPRTEGSSITGGVVYRGSAIPELQGAYLLADYGTGNVWALTLHPGTGAPHRVLLGNISNPIHFAQDSAGEVYVATIPGRIYRLTPREQDAGTPGPTFPRKLSATGCADPADPARPSAGQLPYAMNVPFWSDRAEKSRWLAVPDGKTIHLGDDGDWSLPEGSVLRKDFKLDGVLIETRLLMRHLDGTWAGYSYEWEADGRDASLLLAGKRKTVGAQTWIYPSRAECMRCHTEAAGFTLGLETRQLNRELTYPSTGLRANQLATLEHVGLFDAPLASPPGELGTMPALDGSAPVSQRARAYLASNCSFCHRPGGQGSGGMDLRFDIPEAQLNACNVEPTRGDLGVTGAKLLVPGTPAQSMISLRMHRRDDRAMPPLGSALMDSAGVELIDAWISSLTGCPQ